MSRSLLAGLAVAGLLSVGAASVHAAITFVDATDGAGANTALAAGGTFTPATASTASQWRFRSGFGNGPGIYESNGSVVNSDAPRLATTITGLTPGASYNIFAMFVSPDDLNQSWAVRAGLVNLPGDLQLFTGTNATTSTNPLPTATVATLAQASDFSNTVLVTDSGNRKLFEAPLGATTADINGNVVVYVDDFVATTVNNRTWYDGVGFSSAAAPEPASLSLAGIGAASLLLRRRRTVV
jgi:hypothetical protein